ncbi:MAG: methyltransferase family protein [Planctomycetota bacterium]
MPVLLQKLYVIVVVGPLFIAPLFPQNRFNINPYFSLPAGILLFVLGWIIIIYAFLKIGVIPAIRKKSDLITSGIYRFIRHPIYSGTLIAVCILPTSFFIVLCHDFL